MTTSRTAGRPGEDAASDPPPALHRQRPFLLLWTAQTASEFGSQVTTVALPLTAILVLHANAAQLGVLQTALWLPWLLFALFIGSFVDRHRRRPILIAADIGRTVTLTAIVALAWTGTLSTVALGALMFVLGSLTVLFEVTYQSYLPTVVRHAQLVAANSRLQASAAVASVGGPSIGGLLVRALSPAGTLAIDAASYVISVTSLLAIRRTESPVADEAHGESILARIRQGLTMTYHHRVLRPLVGVAATYNLFSEWVLTLFLLYAIQDRRLGAAGLGVVLAGGSAGAVIGAAIASPVTRILGLGRALLVSVVLECAAFATLPLIGGGHAVATMLFTLLFCFNGIGVALSSVMAVSIRQAATPPMILGRMTASYRTISYGTVALGAALGGVAGQLIGLGPGMTIGALATLATVGWVVFTPLLRLRTLDDAARPPAARDAGASGVHPPRPVTNKAGPRPRKRGEEDGPHER